MTQPLIGKRILIVEDDAIFRSLLVEFLCAQGAEIYEAENGFDALNQQSEGITPDAILCDLSMPVMGGAEFIRQLRTNGYQTPVIIISATEKMADVAGVLRFGVQDVLLKPIEDFNWLKDALLACFYPDIFISPSQEDKELAHYWKMLRSNPVYAISLLKQLQPPVQQYIAGCKINYRQLTSYEHPGLVLDIAGFSASDLFFYCLDITCAGSDGVLAALMIRALFNNLLQKRLVRGVRRKSQILSSLKQVNQMIKQAGLSGQFPLLVGHYHAGLKNLILVSAGLHARVTADDSRIQLNSGVPLGTMDTVQVNQVSQHCAKLQCQIWGTGGHLRLMLTNQNN